MPEKMSKEQWIKQFMEKSGMSRERAEFAAAIETGEIEGDAIIVETLDEDAGEGTGGGASHPLSGNPA